MSVAEIVARRALEPTTDPAELARAHERLKSLSDVDVERDLFQALTAAAPCQAEVRGPTGSGKSSCIMKVVGDISNIAGPPSYEVLMVRAGDADSILGSPGQFAHHLLDVIRSQGFRFASAVQDQLRRVGADETTATDPIRTRTASVQGDAKVVKVTYQEALQRAYEQRTYGQDPARSRQELEDVLTIIRAEHVRPVVVIDDTDKFAVPRPAGVDADAVDGLFSNGVRVLDDLRVDYVVAAHPRFIGVSGYDAAAGKFLRTRLEIPWFDLERRPLSAILAKHLRAHGIEADPDAIVSETALAALWGLYSSEQNLRDTLEVAHRAARRADDRRGETIEDKDVSAALRLRAAG